MTANELRELIVSALVRSHGGSRAGWRRAVGSLRTYARATHAHANWEAIPSGSPAEMEAVEQAADKLRPAHPYVEA